MDGFLFLGGNSSDHHSLAEASDPLRSQAIRADVFARLFDGEHFSEPRVIRQECSSKQEFLGGPGERGGGALAIAKSPAQWE